MKKLFVILILLLSGYALIETSPGGVEAYPRQQITSDESIASAYRNRISNIQVEGAGIVIRTLPDDTEGSKHQRFILELASGQTLFISHNIDLAPRINALKIGDEIAFYGEYEWNSQGGVVHWTHRDPQGRHEHGWLKHDGITYQ
jgi:hypothetical protein